MRVGVIIEFFPENQTANVQIAQQNITSVQPDGTRTSQPFSPLVNVPVFILGGGGYSSTFPIKPGNDCTILFNDRELDNWKTSGGTQSVPSTLRVHDLSDGICLVGLRPLPSVLGGYSTDSAQLRSDDGENFVEIKDGGFVNATATTKITLTAPIVEINASTAAIIHSAGKVSFDADGTGVVYQPALISTYTDGVATTHHAPAPPGPL